MAHHVCFLKIKCNDIRRCFSVKRNTDVTFFDAVLCSDLITHTPGITSLIFSLLFLLIIRYFKLEAYDQAISWWINPYFKVSTTAFAEIFKLSYCKGFRNQAFRLEVSPIFEPNLVLFSFIMCVKPLPLVQSDVGLISIMIYYRKTIPIITYIPLLIQEASSVKSLLSFSSFSEANAPACTTNLGSLFIKLWPLNIFVTITELLP